MTLGHVLDRISSLRARGVLPVVIFDLDSTLIDTAGRHLQILRDFRVEHGDRWPGMAVIDDLQPADFGYDVRTPLLGRGVDDPELLATLYAYWLERYFTSAYVAYDLAAPGAAAFVHDCWSRGAFVYYLTGRPVEAMGVGTVASLVRHGFPCFAGRCALHLKPVFEMGDRAFKVAALDEVRALRGEVVATFENEPANAHAFRAGFPGATHFLFGSVRSPDAEAPHPELVAITSFQR